jgi:hypothetical protein
MRFCELTRDLVALGRGEGRRRESAMAGPTLACASASMRTS